MKRLGFFCVYKYMTNLKLIEVDPTPGGNGLPDSRTTKAVSVSYSALEDYCKENFGKPIGQPDDMWAKYYVIEEADFVIVQPNQSKFN